MRRCRFGKVNQNRLIYRRDPQRNHRAAAGENVPGHGLGLNLARELALIHGGDLRLVRSADDWTEFEVRFRSAMKEMLNHAGAA